MIARFLVVHDVRLYTCSLVISSEDVYCIVGFGWCGCV